MDVIKEVAGDRIVLKGFWLPTSLDKTRPDPFCGIFLNQASIKTTQRLKGNIGNAVGSIKAEICTCLSEHGQGFDARTAFRTMAGTN
jgi:hypothetical protein